MGHYRIILFFLFVLNVLNLKAVEVSAWSISNAKGMTFIAPDGSFSTHARPDEVTEYDTPRFNVLINQEAYIGMYGANNEFGGTGNFCYFDFKDGMEMEVVVSCRKSLGDYDLLPKNAYVYDVEQIGDKILKFKVSKTNQHITLVVNGDYQTNDVLHIFCNDIDDPVPAVDEEMSASGSYFYDKVSRTYYFGAGYHDLSKLFSGGKLTVSGGRSIYVAPGAFVNGQIGISGIGSKIYGHGIVCQSKSGAGSQLSCNNCTDGEVSGVIFYRYKVKGWQTTYTYCSNMNINYIKVICMYGSSTDGMDFQGCHDMTFDNCFVRADDDAVAIKGLSDVNTDPQYATAQYNLTFRRMYLWSSANSGFNIGAETHASRFENIKLLDSEVLYSFDGLNLNGSLDDRAALNICALCGTEFNNILYENIYINRCERLIGAVFKDSFWYGSIQGNMIWEGRMHGITYRNVISPYNTNGNISNDILFLGWHQAEPNEKYPEGTPDKHIFDVTFDNVLVEGEPVTGWENRHIKTNNTDEVELVYDFHFNYVDDIESMQINDFTGNNETRFNIQGMRVNGSYKGLVIKNRNKYIMK